MYISNKRPNTSNTQDDYDNILKFNNFILTHITE